MIYEHLLDALKVLMACTGILGVLFLLGEAVNHLTGHKPLRGFCLVMTATMRATRVAAYVMIAGSVVFAGCVLLGY